MSTGNPIIASDIEVLKEILLDRENCLLVSASDTEEWCCAIHELISNVDLREKISRNALGCVVQNFTWEKRAENILKALRTLAKN